MPDATLQFDVIIVGAGMVGASLAIGLAQQNLKVGLLDRTLPKPLEQDEPPRIRVSAVHLASEQLLRNLGAWQYIAEQRTFPYEYLAVNEQPAKQGIVAKLPDISSWATTRFEAQELGRKHLGHIVENDVIQLGLIKRVKELPNITLLHGIELKQSAVTAGQRSLYLDDGRTLLAPVMIGADGAQSQVRKLAGIGQYAESYAQHAMVLTVRYKGAVQKGTWQAFRPEGPLAFLPLPSIAGQNYGSLVWYDAADTIKQLKSLSLPELRLKAIESFPSQLPSIEEVLQCASFPLVKSHARTYSAERVILAGDAAHTINPLAGQGVNLGFMDAAALIERMGKANLEGKDLGAPELAKAYEKQRRKANQMMMSGMDAFYYGFSNQSAPLQVIRNIGLGIANRSGPLKQKVVEYATGLQGDIPRLARVAE